MSNGTKVGIGSGTLILVIVAIAALFVWRLVEGDTPADAEAYVLLVIGAASALGLAGVRVWQNVRLAIVERDSGGSES